MNSAERHEARYQRRKQKRLIKDLNRIKTFTKWENVFGLTKLIKSYKNVSKASKDRKNTQTWMSNLVVNSRKIQKQLDNNTWKSKGFNEFTIKERGKWRFIQSVDISEKGIQNAFSNNCLVPLITPHLIYDNSASIKGKGTSFAINRLEHHLKRHYRKYGTEGAIYLADFSNYFKNIPHAPMVTEVYYRILNERLMLLYTQLVKAFGDIGLGLGSQVSQISAVYFPNKIDHLIKDKLRLVYARHMDDVYIIHHDIQLLKKIASVFESNCIKHGIVINTRKCRIIKLTHPFTFLKTRFRLTYSGKIIKKLNRISIRKERHRLKSYKEFYDLGLMSYRQIYFMFHSWLLSIATHNVFHVWVNTIKLFNKLFDRVYAPVKCTTRIHKVLMFASKVALYK